MPQHLQLYRFSGKIKGHHGSYRKFFASLQCTFCQRSKQAGIIEELAREFRIYEHPATAIESVAVVVDLNHRRGHLVAVFLSPRQSVKASVDRTCSRFV